jgi:hypothetical protein
VEVKVDVGSVERIEFFELLPGLGGGAGESGGDEGKVDDSAEVVERPRLSLIAVVPLRPCCLRTSRRAVDVALRLIINPNIPRQFRPHEIVRSILLELVRRRMSNVLRNDTLPQLTLLHCESACYCCCVEGRLS